jgi:hypothetical protein
MVNKTKLKRCTTWGTPTFQRCSSRHITWVIVAQMLFKTIVAQQCVPAMTLGYSCSVETRVAEAQECPGLVAEAGEG